MILTDLDIRTNLRNNITPFTEQNEIGVISYGLTCAGYDLTLSDSQIQVVTKNSGPLDPKRVDEQIANGQIVFDEPTIHTSRTGQRESWFILNPGGFALGHSVETITMPSNLSGKVLGKSTYARVGVIVNVTPIEPGWHGQIVIEISNTNTVPVRIYLNEGIGQLQFHSLTGPCERDYARRLGKYQNQQGVTHATVKK